MGARGPAPKPKHLKIVEGNPNHEAIDDLESGLRLPPGAPDEPDWADVFTGGGPDNERARHWASTAWQRVVSMLDPQGILSHLDHDILRDYCICLARVDQCERDISERGLYVETERGNVKNPATTQANQYRSRLKYLEGQLGLTPVARDSLTPGGSSDGESAFDF